MLLFAPFLAAVFYAISTPFSKVLLNNVAPTFMAAFLYLGAGIGVGIMYLFNVKKEEAAERLTKSDLPYTLGMIALDIAAPIFLMVGINLGTAANASLQRVAGAWKITAPERFRIKAPTRLCY